MTNNLKARIAALAVLALAGAMLAPGTALGSGYDSDQKALRSQSLSCGHLGGDCDEIRRAERARKRRCGAAARRAGRRRGPARVRAFAAMPPNNRHAGRGAVCARRR